MDYDYYNTVNAEEEKITEEGAYNTDLAIKGLTEEQLTQPY